MAALDKKIIEEIQSSQKHIGDVNAFLTELNNLHMQYNNFKGGALKAKALDTLKKFLDEKHTSFLNDSLTGPDGKDVLSKINEAYRSNAASKPLPKRVSAEAQALAASVFAKKTQPSSASKPGRLNAAALASLGGLFGGAPKPTEAPAPSPTVSTTEIPAPSAGIPEAPPIGGGPIPQAPPIPTAPTMGVPQAPPMIPTAPSIGEIPKAPPMIPIAPSAPARKTQPISTAPESPAQSGKPKSPGGQWR